MNDANPTAAGEVLARWLNPRRKRFWAVAAILLYTLLGFFAVPPLLQTAIIDAVREQTGRETRIERIRSNPYLLTLDIAGFEMADTDGETLVAFDRLFLDLQTSSLFRRAWTFKAVRLEGLSGQFERYAPGDSRLTRLLAEVTERAGPVEPDADADGLPRLLVSELSLQADQIRFRDHVPADAVDLAFGPASIDIQQLSTLPDRSGQQAVTIRLPNDATVSWQGTIALAPLHSEGSLEIRGSHLEQTTTYLKSVLPLESLQATMSLQTRYRVDELPDGEVSLALDGLAVNLAEVAATGLEPTTEFFGLDAIELSGGALRYPENSLQFAAVRISGPRLQTWLDAAGELNLAQLAPDDAAAAAADGSPAESPAWRLGIDELTLAAGQASFSDLAMDPPASIELEDIELRLNALSNEDGAEFPLQFSAALSAGGSIGFDGAVSILPAVTAQGTATLTALPLALTQPYVARQANVSIRAGTVDSLAEIILRPDGSAELAGTLGVTGLEVLDGVEGQPLAGWQAFETDRFEADSASGTLKFSRLSFREPYARLIINPDLTTNLGGLAVQPEGGEADPGPADGDAPETTVVVGAIEIRDAALDFSDLSLPLPFAARIRKLGGTVSTIDSRSAEPASIRLEGQVDDYGLARIEGDLTLLDPLRDSDVTMKFSNLLMSNLSPYTVQFAGREIAEGKLDLDLVYRIEDGLMKGGNNIKMSDLVLGDAVDHPEAADLPLGLAVALLKDSNGVIDIDLPVEGDVNDPQFRIGGVIWQAFVGLVTKIVTAPFRLLGGLVGSETDDLGTFQFLAGRSDLSPPELEQVALLQDALAKRPELALQVSGAYARDIDIPALQYARLRNEVLARLGQPSAAGELELTMLDERIRGTLEGLFTERFPETPLEEVKAAHTAPPPDDPEAAPVLDDLAYAADLRDRLLAAVAIGQGDLEDLGNRRAEAVRAAFLATGELPAERVSLGGPAETASEDGEWVPMELGLATD